jgi:hypothetical protein
MVGFLFFFLDLSCPGPLSSPDLSPRQLIQYDFCLGGGESDPTGNSPDFCHLKVEGSRRKRNRSKWILHVKSCAVLFHIHYLP